MNSGLRPRCRCDEDGLGAVQHEGVDGYRAEGRDVGGHRDHVDVGRGRPAVHCRSWATGRRRRRSRREAVRRSSRWWPRPNSRRHRGRQSPMRDESQPLTAAGPPTPNPSMRWSLCASRRSHEMVPTIGNLPDPPRRRAGRALWGTSDRTHVRLRSPGVVCRSGPADHPCNGMSEGAGFVNTALLEEEHDQPLISAESDGVVRRMSATKQPSC